MARPVNECDIQESCDVSKILYNKFKPKLKYFW